jgi:uncharacterized membrane protein
VRARSRQRRAQAAQLFLGFGLWLWVAGLFLAPVALRPFCTFICHQRPERSFFVAGTQLPVCARCTGLYLGAALAVPLALLITSRVPASRARLALVVAALPTALTWILEFAGGIPFSNAARFIAALPLGYAAAWLVVAVIGEE